MNPFDGTTHYNLTNSSNQTTNASPRKSLPIRLQMRSIRLPHRRSPRILHFLPHNPHDERPLQRTPFPLSN
jgi:hypothetical protein